MISRLICVGITVSMGIFFSLHGYSILKGKHSQKVEASRKINIFLKFAGPLLIIIGIVLLFTNLPLKVSGISISTVVAILLLMEKQGTIRKE